MLGLRPTKPSPRGSSPDALRPSSPPPSSRPWRSRPDSADDDFKPLVKGDDPSQFELVGLHPETIKVVDGEVRLTGKPNGYFATKGRYKDYVLQFEVMYERPEGLKDDGKFNGNSGLLVNIDGPAKVWPKCIEFQLANSDIGAILDVSRRQVQGSSYDKKASKGATKPVGEWNAVEVISKDGTTTCTLNGVEVSKGTDFNPAEGQIGWQSEGCADPLPQAADQVAGVSRGRCPPSVGAGMVIRPTRGQFAF